MHLASMLGSSEDYRGIFRTWRSGTRSPTTPSTQDCPATVRRCAVFTCAFNARKRLVEEDKSVLIPLLG